MFWSVIAPQAVKSLDHPSLQPLHRCTDTITACGTIRTSTSVSQSDGPFSLRKFQNFLDNQMNLWFNESERRHVFLAGKAVDELVLTDEGCVAELELWLFRCALIRDNVIGSAPRATIFLTSAFFCCIAGNVASTRKAVHTLKPLHGEQPTKAHGSRDAVSSLSLLSITVLLIPQAVKTHQPLATATAASMHRSPCGPASIPREAQIPAR